MEATYTSSSSAPLRGCGNDDDDDDGGGGGGAVVMPGPRDAHAAADDDEEEDGSGDACSGRWQWKAPTPADTRNWKTLTPPGGG